MGWLRGSAWFAGWDRGRAAQELRRFEDHSGRSRAPDGARAVDVRGLIASVQPRDRPLVEHHWATWCAGCVDEMAVIEALRAELTPAVDLVAVSWDRFEDRARPVSDTVAHVGRVAAAHGLKAFIPVIDAEPGEVFEALRLDVHQIPQTRLRDRDGGVLRVWAGPVDAAVRDELRRLLTTMGA